MGRTTKSQWEFGDLFEPPGKVVEPAAPVRRVLTVAELTGQVKRLLETQVGLVWVTGEVSNLRLQASGHAYFTLKDSSSQLACVLFRGSAVPQRKALADGVKLVVQGEVTVYEPRGQYQMVVRQVELQGVGALQLAFERLKQKLQAEGLFAAERKRPLPRCPQRMGLVTSATGAAIRDVLHVIGRRNPGLDVVLAPCRVQGEGAAAEVAAAIGRLNRWAIGGGAATRLDLILVTRGGGSLEDLWCFNEEEVARAIAASEVPIVSAVGHEIDFTISDFVADLRAATPSAAAELITEGVHASRQFVAEAPGWLSRIVRDRLGDARERLEGFQRRMLRVHPRRRVHEQWQRLDDLQGTLRRVLQLALATRRGRWETVRERWRAVDPQADLKRRREGVAEVRRQLGDRVAVRLAALRAALERAEAELRLLSPASVLDRGYSITTDAATGRVMRDASEMRAGQRLRTRLKRGEVESVVAPRAEGGAG